MTTAVTIDLAKTKEHGRYQRLKKKLIAKYGTISRAAAALECHPNAFREVCKGECPGVRQRLRNAGVLPQPKAEEVVA